MSGIYTGPGNPTHGIASTYRSQVYACRCDPCREASTALQRRGSAERAARLKAGEEVEHGTTSTYTNWGCRCPECTESNKAACRDYYYNVTAAKK